MGTDRQMTWDEVVDRNIKLKAKIKQLKDEIKMLDESSVEYDKAVLALMEVNEQLEEEIVKLKENQRLREFVKDVEVYCDRRTHLHEDYSLLKERAQKALEGKDETIKI